MNSKHEANGPPSLPEQHFLTINKLEQSYDYSTRIV